MPDLSYAQSAERKTGHEVFKAGDLGVGDVGQDIGEPGLRIDTVELGGLDEGIGDGVDLPRWVSRRRDSSSSDRQGRRALGGIIVELGGTGISQGSSFFIRVRP